MAAQAACNFSAPTRHVDGVTYSERLPSACLQARPLLDAYLLDELDEAGSVTLADHLRSCAACSAELGGAARLIGLMRLLPEVEPSPDLDERVTLAVIAAHRQRHEHRSWLSDLPRTIARGAARTTGTLVVTIVSVAMLGAAFVFAAAGFIATTANNPTRTPTPPTDEPTMLPVAVGTEMTTPTSKPTGTPVSPTAPPPVVIFVTPEPTPAPTPSAEPTPGPVSPPAVSLSPTSAPTVTPEPTPSPSPSPTDKRRTPPPTQSPSPSPTSSDSAPPTSP